MTDVGPHRQRTVIIGRTPEPTAAAAAAHHRLRVHRGCGYRCATASNWSPTTTAPLTATSRGHASGALPVRPQVPVLRAVRQPCTPPAATTSSCRACAARSAPAASSTRSVHEIADGADTAAWLRDQPWFTGSFATIGLSYLGFTQWALLTDPPPEMAAAVITVGPHDFSGAALGYRLVRGSTTSSGWSNMVAHQEDPGRHPSLRAAGSSRRMVARAAAGVPVGEAGRALLGAGAPWCESWLEHPEHDDPFWAPLQLHRGAGPRRDSGAAAQRLAGPVPRTDADAVRRLRERGVPTSRVTIGPWTHAHMMTKGAPTVLRESLDWLDTHLAGSRGATRSPVRVYVNGAAAGSICRTGRPRCPSSVLYLQPGGRLGDAMPPDDGAARRRSPTTPRTRRPPSAVGCCLPTAATATTPARRTRRRAELHRRRRCRRTSMSSEARSSSCRTRATTPTTTCSSGSARSTPRADPATSATDIAAATADSGGPSRIELDAIAHRFRAGSRIRVLVAGGSHPRFARNLGTGEPLLSGSRHDAGHAHRAPRRRRRVAAACCPPAPRPPVSRLSRAPASAIVGSAASSCTGARPRRVDGQLHPARAARVVRVRASRTGSTSGLACTTSTVSRCLGRKSSRSARTDSAVQICRSSISSRCPRAVDLHGGNDFRAGPQDELVVGAVGGRGVEQVAMLGPHPLGVAVRDRREQQELAAPSSVEPLLVDPALAQQHGLAAVEQRVHGRAPLLERGLRHVGAVRPADAGPHLGTAQRRHGLRRLAARRQRGQQPGRGRGDLGDRGLERLDVGGRRAG